MIHLHDAIRQHIYKITGLDRPKVTSMPSLSILRLTEKSESFENLVLAVRPNYPYYEFFKLGRNRLIIGAMRYGRLKSKDKKQFNRTGSILRRLQIYQAEGNQELLVDIFNMALLEYEERPETKDLSNLNFGQPIIEDYTDIPLLCDDYSRELVSTKERSVFRLVLIGYLCLKEFNEKTHPNAHFEAADDKYHTQEL